MTVTFQGVGTWALSTTSGATITYAFPTGYTKTVGDLMLLVSGGWTGTTTAPTTRPTGFTLRGTSVRTPGGGSIIIFHEWKLVASTGEATPTRTVPTDGNWSSSNNTWNLGGYMLVFRGVDQTTPFDVTDTTNNSAAVSTWTPPAVTLATATTMVVTSAISGDNNQLTLGTANSYTARASGASYSSSVTGLEAFITATRAFTATGAATMPVFSQAVNGPDSWAAITAALRGATAPGAPTSVAGSATGATTANVTWTAPSSTGNAAGGITSYTVEYSSNSGGSWTSAGTSATSPKSVTGLTANTSYIFRVSATNSIGTGSVSTSSSAMSTYFSNTPSNVATSASAVTSTTVPLTWTAPTGTATTSYTVQYSSNGGSTWTSFGSTFGTTSGTITGLEVFKNYIFRVYATNASQNSSNSPNSADIQTDTDGEIVWGIRL